MIYLDNAATTKIHPEVLKAMMPYLTEEYGNPGTLYPLGRKAYDAVERAREQVAEFMGTSDPGKIIFTSGATEGNNAVFAGMRGYCRKRIALSISSGYEHDSVLNAISQYGPYYPSTILPNKQTGTVLPEELEKQMRGKGVKFGLVSIMAVNNETGSRNNDTGLCKTAHDYGAFFHTDFTQGAGEYDVEADKNGFDFVTISSHKIHGPKGVGALYVSDSAKEVFKPIIYGGAHQENGWRGGTENVAGIVGFGKACELAQKQDREYIKNLHDVFLTAIYSECVSFSTNFDDPRYSDDKIVNLHFPGVKNSALLSACAANGVYISAGSACTGKESTPSHVLTALGMNGKAISESVRISFSCMNTTEEIKEAAKIIADCVKSLKNY